MKSKEIHREKLLEYLQNPANEFLPRCKLSTQVLGFKLEKQIHQVFTPDELSEIEAEALEMRRQRYIRHLSVVDLAILAAAAGGDVAAARLSYQRFENWSEKKIAEVTGPDGQSLFYQEAYQQACSDILDQVNGRACGLPKPVGDRSTHE
jgi:hypothetical protein